MLRNYSRKLTANGRPATGPYRVPGGESRLDVQIRMRAAWQDIVAKDDIGSAAIIGHGSATMIFLASLFAQLPQKPLPNTSITILSRFRDIWEISAFGETPHLPA